VTRAIRFRVGVLVVLAATGVGLAGCAAGPSQVNAAAVVGDTAYSVDQVQQEVTDVLNSQASAQQAAQQGKLDTVTRSVVSAQVLDNIIGTAQRREHIVVTDAQIDQVISANGGLDKLAGEVLYDANGVRDLVRDELVEEALTRKYADNLTVTFSAIAVPTRSEAVTKAQQLAANPNNFTSIAASAGQGNSLSDQSISVAQYLTSALTAAQQQQAAPPFAQIFGAPAGTVLAYPDNPAQPSQWVVALVTHRAVAGPSAPAGQSVADSANPQDLHSVGVGLLLPYAQQAGIRISPRYGVWDYSQMAVTASNAAGLGLVIPPTPAAKS
jgi:hypothetical protein